MAFVAYRVNFLNSIFAASCWSCLIILSMFLLTSRVSRVFGWSRGELLLLAGMYNVVIGLFYFLFSKNLDELQELVHLGELDSLLLKPVDSQWLVSFSQVSWRSLARLFIGVLFISFLFFSHAVSFRWISLVSFLPFIFLGISIMYGLSFGIMTLSVWFSNLHNLRDLLFYINTITRYPGEIYHGGRELLFIFLFPLTLAVIVPTRVLAGQYYWGDLCWSVVFGVVFFVLSRKFWQFALRYYTSASG